MPISMFFLPLYPAFQHHADMKLFNPVTAVLLIVIIILSLRLCLGTKSTGRSEESGSRAQVLQCTLAGSDRVVTTAHKNSEDNSTRTTTINDRESISNLIINLEFDDLNSGFHCMCGGDSSITFFKGTNKLARISHHHGRSLRWDGWEGDSLFTEQAAEYWRIWFLKQGEARFEEMYQQKVKEHNEHERIHALFLSSFPEGAKAVFDRAADDSNHGPITPKNSNSGRLEDLFPQREGLAIALAKSLGVLSTEGAGTGSWNVTSTREQMALQLAGTLSLDELRETSSATDPIILAGSARLFFYEGHAMKYLDEERAQTAAKLCRTVLEVDRCGNADHVITDMKYFPCKETTLLLEELAAGEISLMPPNFNRKWKEDPSPQIAGCLMLAYMESPKTLLLIQEAEKQSNLNEFDNAALKVARALLGEKGLLDASVFEPFSYTIGCGAIDALEKKGDIDAIDLVIMEGTTHRWGAVRSYAVSTAARMTGQSWDPEKWESEGAARRWWKENRDSYLNSER